jgi:hypothetical protein
MSILPCNTALAILLSKHSASYPHVEMRGRERGTYRAISSQSWSALVKVYCDVQPFIAVFGMIAAAKSVPKFGSNTSKFVIDLEPVQIIRLQPYIAI